MLQLSVLLLTVCLLPIVAVESNQVISVVKCSKKVACPNGYTCCEVDHDKFVCCPHPQGVCCADHMHCCPRGYRCSDDSKTCSSGKMHLLSSVARPSSQIVDLKELVQQTHFVSQSPDIICPDGQSECPDGNTCCKLSSGQWGCCPVPDAVCCSDGVHCCPNGYTCDVSTGECSKDNLQVPMVTKIAARQASSVECPDGQSQCPDGNTCCEISSGQWGCCPLPKAVCCSDGVHCCPNGYTCDVSSGKCSKRNVQVPMVAKVVARQANSVVCPDGQSQCPDGNTCCEISSGQWGCCPLPKAVCCADKVHCCPNGYICDRGTCHNDDVEVPMVTKIAARPVSSVMCPDGQSECPEGNTCCKLSSGQWGCCPVPKAVCCSDGVHCCPNGYTCDVSSGQCSKRNVQVPMVAKVAARQANNVVCPDGQSQCPDGNTCCEISSGQWGCCPLPKAVCCADKVHCCPNGYICDRGTCHNDDVQVPMVTKIAARPVNNVVCPGGGSQCPDGNTCCKLSSGQWGCCPVPKAVCCSDGIHCCPNGYTCDVSTGQCSKKDVQVPMVTKIAARPVRNVVCPGGESQCPDGSTCCKLSSGQWGCCPLPEAVCCSDGIHCCPNGYTCDVSSGHCSKDNVQVPMVTKIAARPVNNVVCPGGGSQCPDGNTCCEISSGQWGCCPLPKAVCCADKVHCCPNGYICDRGTCHNDDVEVPMVTKIAARPVNNVVCPGGRSQCPDGNTCCKLSSGQWGCCPLPGAVCCSDGVHCCPNGYTCDVSTGQCSKDDVQVPMVTKIAARPVRNVVCPGGGSQCPDGNTCCKLSSGQWGCCPVPKAVCCSDGVHCCPNGYTCDVSTGQCSKDDVQVPMVTKIAARPVRNVVCPGGGSQCPDGNTCCKLSSGQWGCCPVPKAVCCSDGVHCCPNGYTCDVSTGQCSKDDVQVPMVTKIAARPVRNVVCPGGGSQCPDGNTCCKLSSGQWGCCPVPKAVCCSDGVHCCPNGYTCDVSTGQCSKDDVQVPMVTKIAARPVRNVVCPGGGSQCPDGNTCCKLSSGQWGCCPVPKAVCCSDGVHCCPNGYTCDVSSGQCSKRNVQVPMVTKIAARLVRNVVCPGGGSQCPDGNTCCKLLSGQWGCCPLPEAVCCSDGIHCCPNGYTCDVSTGQCSKDDVQVPMVTKIAARPVRNVVCPGGGSQCPDGNTCCKLLSGQWGCCPLPEAVCCSDGIHCCPNGYTCDVSTGQCSKDDVQVPMVTKIAARPVRNVVCPGGGSQCPDGNTCCKLLSGQWGCCPLPEAVCCSDGIHCCPNGYTCEVSSGHCSKEDVQVPMVAKLATMPFILCPDGKSKCQDGYTCCKLADGYFGCCPLKNAECCSDGKHCCPEGYKCDLERATCLKGGSQLAFALLNEQGEASMQNTVCPDGSQCLDYETCCPVSGGGYGCCPMPQAVCCSDLKHCCPSGYRCDLSAGTCILGSKAIKLLSKLKAIHTSIQESKSNQVEHPSKLDQKLRFVPKFQDNSQQCSGQDQATCGPYNTCCALPSGGHFCCPLPQASCCADGLHCCPQGFSCDAGSGKCKKGDGTVPLIRSNNEILV